MENEKMQDVKVQMELEELRKNPEKVKALLLLIEELFESKEIPCSIPNSLQSQERKLNDVINYHLRNIGVSPSLCGYRYLISAITIIVEEPQSERNFTSYIYQKIAEQHNISWSGVERSIRVLIEELWKNEACRKNINYYFGNSIYKRNKRPTNKQFVLCLVNWVKKDMN